MIQILVVTLGRLGETLIESADRIIGSSPRVEVLSLDWQDDLDRWTDLFQKRVRAMKKAGNVLVLTDMYGGSATNIAIEHLEEDRLEVVTGVNLPMLIKAVTLPDGISLSQAATQLRTRGQKSIYIASEML